MKRFVAQPGPASEERINVIATRGRRIEVTLSSEVPLEAAVAEALAAGGAVAAWLSLEDATVAEMAYVTPAHATDAVHAAWYSDVYRFGAGRIETLGMIVGRHGDASFLHGHGIWAAEDGPRAMGHVLAPQTVLARPTRARGIALTDAGFARLPDVETNFELFQTTGPGQAEGDFAVLRVAPNSDFISALQSARMRLGWEQARAYGIGSLIGAVFADGTTLDSLPTEFLIRDAVIRDDAAPPDIAIVGIDGTDIREGRIAAQDNAVLITAEIVLERLGPPE